MLFNIVDIFCILLALFYLWRGWKTGILRCFISPIFFTIFFIISIIVLDVTNNIFLCTQIVVLGTLFCSVLVNIFILIGRRSISKEFRNYVFWGSRLAGSMVSLLWKGSITMVIVLLVAVLPGRTFAIKNLQKKIVASQTYGLVNIYIVQRICAVDRYLKTISIVLSPEFCERLISEDDYARFYGAPKVMDLRQDDSLAIQIRKKQVFHIFFNPVVANVTRDKNLMERLTNIIKKVLASQTCTQD